jgi:hypothetical protein
VSFAAITLCVASQRVFVVVDLVNDSVRKLLDTPSYINSEPSEQTLISCPVSILIALVSLSPAVVPTI